MSISEDKFRKYSWDQLDQNPLYRLSEGLRRTIDVVTPVDGSTGLPMPKRCSVDRETYAEMRGIKRSEYGSQYAFEKAITDALQQDRVQALTNNINDYAYQKEKSRAVVEELKELQRLNKRS